MTVRISILDSAGVSVLNLNGNHSDAHAAHWLQVNLALLKQHGIDGAIGIEYDVDAGGDDHLANIKTQGSVRAELRVRPDGMTEVVGLVKDDARGRMYVSTRMARTVRVIHGPAQIVGAGACIRAKGRTLDDLARHWISVTDPRYQRTQRRLEAAKGST